MAVKNGQIPSNSLKTSVIGVQLIASAANSANRLAAEWKKERGTTLRATDGYRSLSVGRWSQRAIFLDRYVPYYTQYATGRTDARKYNGVWYYRKPGTAAAAVPGTSNHGLGLAVDFASGINVSFASDAYKWMVKNAGKHGWSNAEGMSVGEPWHWTYTKSKDRMRVRNLAIVGYMNKTAYKRWQAQLGVKADGIWGPGSIERLQEVLNGKDGKGGFSLKSGKLVEDGVAGSRTWKAVQKLINVWYRRGSISLKGPLKVDGKPGSRTIKALRKTINADLW